MIHSTPPFGADPAPTLPVSGGIAEVRYSYKEMMRELKAERTAAVFSMEKLDQVEIGKLFKSKRTRRDKDKR